MRGWRYLLFLQVKKMNLANFVEIRVIEAINSGEDLAAFFNDLFKNRATCNELIGPAVSMLTRCYVLARNNGVNFGGFDESVREFFGFSENRMLFDLMKTLNTDPVLAGSLLSGLVAFINVARKSGHTWHIPDRPQNSPVPVVIVSMVDRVTNTEVVRDGKGAITGSKQTESDAICPDGAMIGAMTQ